MNINLPKEDWAKVVYCIDHRLYDMDQEAHFFQEEFSPEYYQLIEIRDYILSFTNPENTIESKNPTG
jgi:hypothetical protein